MDTALGVLATVQLVETTAGRLWLKFLNGNFGFVPLAAGPPVLEGDSVLVLDDDGTFIEAPAEVTERNHVGSLGTVARLDPAEGVFWVRYTSGGVGPLKMSDGPPVVEGSVILSSGSGFSLAPSELVGPPSVRTGVVRRVGDGQSLVETEQAITWIQHEGSVDWAEWSTVEISNERVVRQLSSEPMRYRDEIPATSTVSSRFRVDSSKLTDGFDGIEGLDGQIEELREIISMMRSAESLRAQGMRPIRGLLLAGESGTGKTMLARVLAKEADAAYFHVRGPEIASKYVNESEEMLRALMDEADSLERAVVFFDEIDSLGGARSDTAHEMSNKLITQFLALLDGFDDKPGRALVVGATNRPESLDPTMLRSGRFDRRINFALPSRSQRASILAATKPASTAPDTLELDELASLTPAWSSADLRALWARAFQFTSSEGRTKILQLDCRVAIEKLDAQIRARQQLAGSGE